MEGVCVLENGADFYDKYYQIMNEFETSAEGVSYIDFMAVTHNISKDRYDQCIEYFQK